MSRARQHGFTLLKLSIVVLILSLMLSGILTVVTQKIRIEKRAQLAEKFARIQTAMLDYRKVYNRLPCPSAIDRVDSNEKFGLEGGPPAQCADETIADGYVMYETAAPGAFGGGVPVKTLKLPDEYAFDPWGNNLLYVVDYRITDSSVNNPFNAYSTAHTSIGNITIRDLEGDAITTRALYVLLSHGPNGHGAWTRGGQRRSASSTNAAEQINCHCTVAAADNAFTAVFYQSRESTTSAGLTTGFDDITVYFQRGDLLSAAEEAIERQ